MTDWHVVVETGCEVPHGGDLRGMLEELCDMLASPDPVQRDDIAYSVVATWVSKGVLPRDLCRWLGDEMAARMSADDVWVRTFAPLVLDVLVSFGTFDPAWVPPFSRWYATETDLRGHEPDLGWLHAVAHGADLLGALGLHPEVAPASMLELAGRRLVAPSDAVWRHNEDERLGHAIALTLTRPELTSEESVAWVQPVEDSWTSRPSGPPAAWVQNASRTLRVVLGATLTGTRPGGEGQALSLTHAKAVQERLLSALHTLTPWMW
ncbi:DUF2785 domain-containing protein [Nocardioides sp. Soil805]|uniref:DUF2785 domain-containing protein n=1 Tax=Nocardioides sp. Soil805 TaxID=1736416 RepID=UPI0009E93888|nr:DUF2785 domain-containing protein [Nocardioides sp. Soil805]